MKVLVTGCAGYIGSVLVRQLLDARCKVVGTDNLMYDNGYAILPYMTNPNFEFFKCGVLDTLMYHLIRYCDAVIPLAAIVGAPACERNPVLAKLVNQDAIEELVNHAQPDTRIVYPNTNSGYGQTTGSTFCTEKDSLNPISVYGKTKCAAEKAVLRHENSVVLRLATVFGPSHRMRMDLMVNDFTQRLVTSRDFFQKNRPVPPLIIYEPHFKRNFVHVQDVARAFVYTLMRPYLRGVFNVGLPTANLTKLELAHTVCDTVALSREVVRIGEGQDVDKRNYLVSSQKIIDAGFLFHHDLVEGIKQVAKVCSILTPQELKKARNA